MAHACRGTSRSSAVLLLGGIVLLSAAACEPYGCTYADAVLSEISGTATLPAGDTVPFFDRSAVGGSPRSLTGLKQAVLENQGAGSLHAVWRHYVPDRQVLVTLALAVPVPLASGETLGVDVVLPEGNVMQLPAPTPGTRYPVHAWLDSGAPLLLDVSGVVVVERVRPLQLRVDVASHAADGHRQRLAARVVFFEGRVAITCPD